MTVKKIALSALIFALPVGSVMADAEFWRHAATSAATTGSTYLTSRHDHKLVMAQDDASSFVASNGAIRGPFLEAALNDMRSANPDLQARSDMELATSLLAQQQ